MKRSRRQFLQAGLATAGSMLMPSVVCALVPTIREGSGTLLNDIQSRLNPTRVRRVIRPRTASAVARAVRDATRDRLPISMSGARHAMGGQQFGARHLHLDLTGLDRIVEFDQEAGLVEAEAGIMWPALMDGIARRRRRNAPTWGIIQKQTGLDHLTLGGALAANVHGRGLNLAPIISNVESFTIVNASGEFLNCSRLEHAEMFRLAIGGYGLLGPMTRVRLRLARRTKLTRHVESCDLAEALTRMETRARDGWPYGDFQFLCDPRSDGFLDTGILNTYGPAADDAPITGRSELSAEDFKNLALAVHRDPGAAFRHYADALRTTSGHVYWHDDQQKSLYVPGYHQ